ncbi:MAG: hypothetical protein K2I00_01530 [Ruminococcus sp.]|nr:hypothetical protein [Ruminococcus sp.]
MKKLKAILIIIILVGLVYTYQDDIASFISNLNIQSRQNSHEYVPETDRSTYEYYFKSFMEKY